MYQKFL
jgi:hypothetical protein